MLKGGATHLNDDDVTGNDVAGLNFHFLAVADDNRAKSNAGLELLDNVAGSLFLVPTNESVLN